MKALLLFACIFVGACTTPPKKIYILGSFHDLRNVSGANEKFSDIVSNIDPDFIFIESPVDWFDEKFSLRQDHLVTMSLKKKVPVEKLFDEKKFEGFDLAEIIKFSKRKSVKLIPFDIEKRNYIQNIKLQLNQNTKKLTNFINSLSGAEGKFLKEMYLLNHRSISSLNKLGVEVVNGYGYGAIVKNIATTEKEILNFLKAKKDYSKRDEVIFLQEKIIWWERRNKAMSENICNFSKKLEGSTFLLHTGSFHKPTLLENLKNCKHLNIVDNFF